MRGIPFEIGFWASAISTIVICLHWFGACAFESYTNCIMVEVVCFYGMSLTAIYVLIIYSDYVDEREGINNSKS